MDSPCRPPTFIITSFVILYKYALERQIVGSDGEAGREAVEPPVQLITARI